MGKAAAYIVKHEDAVVILDFNSRDRMQVHNISYSISQDRTFNTEAQYIMRYLINEWIDMNDDAAFGRDGLYH